MRRTMRRTMRRNVRSTIKLLPLAVSAFLITAPVQATDGFASGLDLKGWCDNMDLNDIHWGLCVGSITAAHDVIMSYQEAGAVNTVVCTTLSITRGDAVFAVVDYLNENPNDLDYSLGDVVLTALAEKFPCD